MRLHHQVRVLRFLVGRGNTGVVLDLAGPGQLVQPLHVAFLAHLQGAFDKNLEKIALADDLPHLVPVLGQGRDKGGQADRARIEEELDHLADAPQVLRPALAGKTQVPAQAVAHVVAVKGIGADAGPVQFLLHQVGQGGLARAGQAREPERPGAVAVLLPPPGPVDQAAVDDHVG